MIWRQAGRGPVGGVTAWRASWMRRSAPAKVTSLAEGGGGKDDVGELGGAGGEEVLEDDEAQ